MNQLNEMVNDTFHAAGGETYNETRMVYQFAKSAPSEFGLVPLVSGLELCARGSTAGSNSAAGAESHSGDNHDNQQGRGGKLRIFSCADTSIRRRRISGTDAFDLAGQVWTLVRQVFHHMFMNDSGGSRWLASTLASADMSAGRCPRG
ncbi:MAG: hypothetical protein KDA55_05010, partial [Planctomycetales bacterium]|nr:hypothetical protein [Planctomycetales bacterium]